MRLPLDDLLLHQWPQWGLLVAVVIGAGFGFVLERAGFGRATKLAAQFYLTDMTVLKVMFGAIVTAALGSVIADGLGLIELRQLASLATSWTYLWPMIAGGLLLGVGFIVAGYCPGTSVVSAASGNVDGMVTLVGVGLGCLLFAETAPMLGTFTQAGNLGHVFLYDLVPVPPAVVAAGVALAAVGAFVAADVAERRFGGDGTGQAQPGGPRRFTFAAFGLAALVGLGSMALAITRPAASAPEPPTAQPIDAPELARRVVEEPWTVRVLDLRDESACAERRIPGAECVPLEILGDIGLAYAPADIDLILVGENTLGPLPEAARPYRGDILTLEGGFHGWRTYALTEPVPPQDGPRSPQWEQYRQRAGLYSALTGVTRAPPPPPATTAFVAPPPSGGGGCG